MIHRKAIMLLAMLSSTLSLTALANIPPTRHAAPQLASVYFAWPHKPNTIGYTVYRISCGRDLHTGKRTVTGICRGTIELVDFVVDPEIVDVVTANTTYEYYVTSLDADGVERAFSSPVLITPEPSPWTGQ